MYTLEFHNISKKFRGLVIADEMNMQISENTFSVIFGAPGSGKSTLLRLITGLERPEHGDILMYGKVINKLSPGERNIGYVPQSFALYPHYSVFDNIAYPLKLMGVPKREYTPIVERTAERLQIQHLLKKQPNQCSGGEKQRVAIARGIIKNTKVFILDDPLTGLDFKLRERLFDDLRQMREDLQATFIYTTSDPLEALMLAEDIHVFDGGKIVEAGKIDAVYAQPKHIRTMTLLGYPNTNVLHGQVMQNGNGLKCETSIGAFRLDITSGTQTEAEVYVALRPQDIEINPSNPQGLVTLHAEIDLVEDLGGELHVYLKAGGIELEAVIPHHESNILTEGNATIGIAPHHLSIFDVNSSLHLGQGAL